jgi:hypothetical protein
MKRKRRKEERNVHTWCFMPCNLSYLGGSNQEDHNSRPDQEILNSTKKLSMVAHACHLSYVGILSRRKYIKAIWKITKAKKG